MEIKKSKIEIITQKNSCGRIYHNINRGEAEYLEYLGFDGESAEKIIEDHKNYISQNPKIKIVKTNITIETII
jgi:hypothetical protein